MTAKLRVNTKKLRDGLKMAGKLAKGTGGSPMLLAFAGGKLVMTFQSMTISADAEGEWPGQARLPASVVRLLYQSIPGGDDPVEVTVRDGRLSVGRSSVPCVWEEAIERIQLPAGAPLWAILALRLRHNDDIRRSGLDDLVEKAEADRERRLARAADALQPLGIDEAHLRRLFEERLKQRAGE